jgi:hypothetical protein
MSDANLLYELLATNASVIVRVWLPGDVSYDAEFSASRADIESISVEKLPGGGLKVGIVRNGVSITRIISPAQLPAHG